MAGAPPQIEWYIARDGQQHGPLSDIEMRKFVELGHLRPTDLVWRQGFPDWRPAPAVFPAPVQPRPQPAPARPAVQPVRQTAQRASAPRQAQAAGAPHQSQPAAAGPRAARPEARHATNPVAVTAPFDDEEADLDDDDLQPGASGGRGRRLIKMLALLTLLGGASWVAVDYIPNPSSLLALLETRSEGSEATQAVQPLTEAGDSAAEIDSFLQRTRLWQILKREFPEWYQQRVEEAARVKSGGGDDNSLTRHLTQALVALRRQHAQEALAASPDALRNLAGSFLDSLKHLSAHSTQACYGFISQGESNPQVLELMNAPEHLAPLQRQVAAMFAAVAEGRKSPQTHLPPRQSDYQALTQELANRGWTDREIKLFSNPRALAQASPDEVCKLVQDWFAAQLAIEDQAVQLRLLIESLKPVVAG